MPPTNRPDDCAPLPESALGGTSDMGAHGRHPASNPEAPPFPDQTPGDAAIERRHHHDENYRGPERRLGHQRGSRA